MKHFYIVLTLIKKTGSFPNLLQSLLKSGLGKSVHPLDSTIELILRKKAAAIGNSIALYYCSVMYAVLSSYMK